MVFDEGDPPVRCPLCEGTDGAQIELLQANVYRGPPAAL
jgi:hypothetical protein